MATNQNADPLARAKQLAATLAKLISEDSSSGNSPSLPKTHSTYYTGSSSPLSSTAASPIRAPLSLPAPVSSPYVPSYVAGLKNASGVSSPLSPPSTSSPTPFSPGSSNCPSSPNPEAFLPGYVPSLIANPPSSDVYISRVNQRLLDASSLPFQIL